MGFAAQPREKHKQTLIKKRTSFCAISIFDNQLSIFANLPDIHYKDPFALEQSYE
jgi:hypothetical protein